MLPSNVRTAIADTVSGVRALDYVIDLSRFHRIQASPGIHQAILCIKDQIERVSEAQVTIHQYTATGEGSISTWDSLYAWYPKTGTLQLIEPESRRLADFQTEPISLAAHSVSADIEADVVYVGKGLTREDYTNKDVRGKIVLTESRASLVHKIACIEMGAAGILTYVPPSGVDEIASLRRYEALWPDPGEASRTGFGFALRQADGVKIQKMLAEGKRVRVRATVDAELKSGPEEVLSAVIPGKDSSKEVWLMAHICHPHPGANDNASGAGAIMEVLRVVTRLIAEGQLETPQYSIRFVWVPEWHGTIRLIHGDRELVNRALAVINVDMVGADPAKAGSTLKLYRTPHSLPSTLNNVLDYWLRTESATQRDPAMGGTMCPLPYEYHAYSAGSDHFMFTDSTLSIPAVMLNQDPDRFYHTSCDSTDKLDVRQMAYVSRALVLSAVTLAYPALVCKESLLTATRNEMIELMTRVGMEGVDELSSCKDDPEKLYPKYMRWLGYAYELGRKTLERAIQEWPLITVQRALANALRASLEMAYTSEMMVLRKAYEGACVGSGLEPKEEGQIKIDPSAFQMEVRRKVQYALRPSYIMKARPESRSRYLTLLQKDQHFMSRVDELLNLSAEWRSLTEVWDRICFQFGYTDPSTLSKIVDDMRELGLIETRDV
ncbi:MAG: DUF4910 domain-containing protein [Candidatus Thorarchaeota archaeon]|nr:DUF4910 domain-containing protein [Candidatus Thorarchaeota archaeon]